jgi:hypothetical protein
MNKTHPKIGAFIACLQVEDVGHGETNQQFEYSLLQRWNRSCWASGWTLTIGCFKEINFSSYRQSF